MIKRAWIICWVLLVLSGMALGEDYFLFDRQEQKLLIFEDGDEGFEKGFEVAETPSHMIYTGRPEVYLGITYGSNVELGKLTRFNLTGLESEEVASLGYAKFQCNRSPDGLHFFAGYRNTSDWNSHELLHYSLDDNSVERIRLKGQIRDITAPDDAKEIYVLTEDAEGNLFVSRVSYSPLVVQMTVPAGHTVERLYALNRSRVAWVDDGEAKKVVRLADMETGEVAEEIQLQLHKTYKQWFQMGRTLIVATDSSGYGLFGYQGQGEIVRVTDGGMKYHKINTPWLNLNYNPLQERMYMLTKKDMRYIDYKTDKLEKILTGDNLFKGSYFMSVYRLEIFDRRFAGIYCPFNGKMKIVDLVENKVVKSVRFGEAKLKRDISYINTVFFAANTMEDKVYMVSQYMKELSVFDKDFNQIKVIPLQDNPLDVKGTGGNVLIFTKDKIQALNEDDTLRTVAELKFGSASFYSDNVGERVLVWTKSEVLVLDRGSLEVKQRFSLMEEVEGKKGVRRFGFVWGY